MYGNNSPVGPGKSGAAFSRRAFMAGSLALPVLVGLAACTPTQQVSSSGTGGKSSGALINMVAENTNTFTRTFNPFSPTTRWASTQAMYEPLMIFNYATGKLDPWLATGYNWSPDGKVLTLKVRDGVKWSDGKPFTADDVAYTFNLMKKNNALIGPASTVLAGLASVTSSGSQVTFTLQAPDSVAIYDLAAQFIVPKHVWSGIGDPVKFQDPDPVATGPFTTVKMFTAQQYQLTKNPHYWQPLNVEGIQLKGYSGNDQISAAVASGQVDWGGLIAEPDKTFVAKDPKHNHYWWPTPTALFLLANVTRPSLSDVNVRKAISMTLDRQAMIDAAVWGKSTPANGVGLTEDGSKKWIYQAAVAAGADWVAKDVAKANALLDQAGYPKGSGGTRTDKAGAPLSYTIIIPSNFTDWISDAKSIGDAASAIGVQIELKALSLDTWTNQAYSGDFDFTLFSAVSTATPYELYHNSMGPDTVKPVGTVTAVNYQRFGDPQAGALLEKFTQVTDPSQQSDIMNQLQSRFADIAPMIPLYGAPDWGLFTTNRFTGFPDSSNQYSPLSLHNPSTPLLVFPKLRAAA